MAGAYVWSTAFVIPPACANLLHRGSRHQLGRSVTSLYRVALDLLVVLAALTGLWGAWRFWRVEPVSPLFWAGVRATQALLVGEAVLLGVLWLGDHRPD